MKAKHWSSANSSLRLLPLSLLLAFIAYYPILNSYFLSDDFVQIGKVIEGDWSLVWGREHGGFFRPLFILSYIIDSLIWGDRPLGYHVTNLLLHGLNSYLVYNLSLSLLGPQNLAEDSARGISLAASLLFLLHPSHTEAVSWISGRADLLATLFCLAALLAYVFHIEKGRTRYLLLSLIFFALALLSKESAASLPLILFAVGSYYGAGDGRRRAALMRALKTSALFFTLLLFFVVLRRASLGGWLGGYGADQHLNFSPGWIRDRFLQASIRSVLPSFPVELSQVLLKPLKSTAFILFAIASVCLIALLLRRRRQLLDKVGRRTQNRLVLFFVAAFVFSLLPVINLRISPLDTQGERFIYWPSVFASMLSVYLAFILLRGRRWRLVLLLCVLVLYSVSLYRTNQTWREAAELSRSISRELAHSASNERRLIVINAPDNLRGVPVFHNGLEEALRLFQKGVWAEALGVLSLHGIQSLNDGAELKMEGEGFALSLTNHADGFTKVAGNGDCVEVYGGAGGVLRFRLKDCEPKPSLFFFNAGKMYRVIDGRRETPVP